MITREDLKRIQTYSLTGRKSLASSKDFGSPLPKGASLEAFLDNLPNIYMAKDLKRVATKIRECGEQKKTIHLAMGSHVIKNGLAPYLLDLMRRGLVTALSFNGSALVHDFEIAFQGATSEDVDAALGSGMFGVAKETAENVIGAIGSATGEMGLGRAMGEWILKKTSYPEQSLLAEAARLNIPATVHLAIGTDIIHIHPGFDAAKASALSYQDFLLFASSIAALEDGIYLNIGSAVILPEVFLKAVSLVRNLGFTVEKFWAVNLDFIRQYRPRRNVLERPTKQGGQAIELIGPHELLIPLLHAAIMTK